MCAKNEETRSCGISFQTRPIRGLQMESCPGNSSEERLESYFLSWLRRRRFLAAIFALLRAQRLRFVLRGPDFMPGRNIGRAIYGAGLTRARESEVPRRKSA